MTMRIKDEKVAPWIQTLDGYAFDFLSMYNNLWRPLEVARVLSRTFRFAGHSKWPYTVAQHSVLVARQFTGSRLKLPALLHDVPEVFIGDISSPLKYYLSSDRLKRLEKCILKWVADKHGFVPEVFEEIKKEDLAALATEARDLMCEPPRPWIDLPPPWDYAIEPWHPEFAESKWLIVYEELVGLDWRMCK